MPRKYNPSVKTDYAQSDWDIDYTYATMEESKYGEWVPLKVFEDETNRLNTIIDKLKIELNNIKDIQ
jgi:hypothetical protein